ncbi:YcxB family protein [Clostridium sp. AF22-10]|uniref:YcxB family protein n=2 Tax=unclassified Clostridium TaxID=2614128 RepID=UPI000E5164C7|nr:YcxB family protein [Clostridium sp. AF22-10]
MDLRVKIQPKEIFIYSMYNFWAGLRGIGCIILTVLVIIAAAASEERLGTQVTNLVILGVIALTGFQIFAIWKQAERTAGDAKTGAEIVFHIGDEGIRARQANGKGEISWDKLVKVKKIAGIYVLYLGRDKAYLMPKRVFRGSEEQIFLSSLQEICRRKREEEFEHDDRNKQPGRDVCVWKKAWNGSAGRAGVLFEW